MRKLLIGLCACVLCFSGCGKTYEKGTRIVISNPANISTVASCVSPAIVGICGEQENGESVGSGVCVTESGYILTNSHVVHDCNGITLFLSDKSTTTAQIVYEDTVLDLAILKSKKAIPYLELGNSDELEVGQDILAVGTPLSLTLVHTFTKGIVSALNRTLKVSSTKGEGYMQNLIQHDASLNPGNSGGPLINQSGQVVGINTLKISSGEGIGFAIPSKSFKSLITSFSNKINYEIPHLGVYGFDNEIATYHGKNNLGKGFYVMDISNDSPLNLVGMNKGSVIVGINDKTISNALDLKDELYKSSAGERMKIEYVQDGKKFSGVLILT